MARFLGSVCGQTGNAVTRLGSANSGLQVKGNGWNIGGKVWLYPSRESPTVDEVTLTLTSGSNDVGSVDIYTFTRGDFNLLAEGRNADELRSAIRNSLEAMQRAKKARA